MTPDTAFVLRHRSFVVRHRSQFPTFFAGQAVSLLGDGLAILAIPLMVLELTHDPLAAALAAVPRTLGYLAVGLPAGIVVDRMSPRRLMVLTDLVRLAVFLLVPALSWAGALTVGMLLGLAFVAAAAGVLFETALTVAVKDLVPDNRLMRANGLLEQANHGAAVLGPGIVGLLAAAFDLRIALLVNAMTFAVSLWTLLAIPDWARATGGDRSRAGPRSLAADFVAGLRCLVERRIVLAITVLQAVVNLCLAVVTLLVFHLEVSLGLPAPSIGIVVACGGAGGVVGAAIASLFAHRLRETTVIVIGVVVAGPALALVGVVRSVPLLGATYVSVMAAVVMSGVAIRALRQRLVPRELLGRVTSTGRVLALSTYPLGAAGFGALAGTTGGDTGPLFVVAGVTLTAAALALFGVPGLRREQHDR